MKYKFKKLEEAPVTHDLTLGGYLKAETFSNDKSTIKAINDAVALLKKIESMCEFL